jgi:Fe-S-cluster containining protein
VSAALPIIDEAPARCTGHCCRSFWLPYSPAELLENYQAWKGGRFVKGRDRNDHPQASEIWLIAPMAIYLGYLPQNPQKPEPLINGAHGHFYRCAHVRENGDCGIYEMRPKMCRDYPYGTDCDFPGCTMRPLNGAKETP